ncbi:MAG: hypothetical protein CM1200mP30_33990 [Pseudomonadota bacterium]|nr:MAG: hypothetical protein CM1200mP30_33990 [Pseudomonadota bacterium]
MCFKSILLGTAISIAADGVGARTSLTKSAIVKSVSCPTAEITGISDEKIALASCSSLKAHKSSIEPPLCPQSKRQSVVNHEECLNAGFLPPTSLAQNFPAPWGKGAAKQGNPGKTTLQYCQHIMNHRTLR